MKNKICLRQKETERESRDNLFYFISLLFFSRRYTEIGLSEFVGTRTKRLYSTKATRENQRQRIFAKFSIKNSENPMFWFFLDLRLSDGQN